MVFAERGVYREVDGTFPEVKEAGAKSRDEPRLSGFDRSRQEGGYSQRRADMGSIAVARLAGR